MSSTATARFVAERSALDHTLGELTGKYLSGVDATARDAVAYALAGEGKRLRALLLLSAYRATGGTGEAMLLAAAIEVVHAYSLVHDDLPCMDDDAVRRGRPTVHKAFGVRAASAAGLTMVPLAARVAFDGARQLGLEPRVAAMIVRELMHASGASGMIGGQLLDLEGENRALSLPELERVHSLKTGALIAASVRLGGMAAGASQRELDALVRFGRAVGLAFQIADDVLDATSTTDRLGKTARKDESLHKSTYPALLGVEAARARAAALAHEACTALAEQRLLTEDMEYLARFSVVRES